MNNIFKFEKCSLNNGVHYNPTDYCYKIKDYYISTTELTDANAAKLIGKKIRIIGKLKIVPGKTYPAAKSDNGRIYEPYKEPERKYLFDIEIEIVK